LEVPRLGAEGAGEFEARRDGVDGEDGFGGVVGQVAEGAQGDGTAANEDDDAFFDLFRSGVFEAVFDGEKAWLGIRRRKL
jgi:hypothetical protein